MNCHIDLLLRAHAALPLDRLPATPLDFRGYGTLRYSHVGTLLVGIAPLDLSSFVLTWVLVHGYVHFLLCLTRAPVIVSDYMIMWVVSIGTCGVEIYSPFFFNGGTLLRSVDKKGDVGRLFVEGATSQVLYDETTTGDVD